MTAIGTLPIVLGTGIHSARPSASAVGKGGLYSCTTHSLVYQTDGSSWTTWATLGGSSSGALTLLEQHSASSSATLDFTTFYSSTYDDYQFHIVDLVVATDNVQLLCRLSTDGGSTYISTSDYYSALVGIQNDGSSTTNSANGTSAWELAKSVDNSSARSINGDLIFRSLASTALHKTVHGPIAYSNQSFVVGALVQGLYTGTTAVNAIRFLASSGNLASGTIRVYGVAKT